MKTRMIYNKKERNIPRNAIYIGRGSKWGNPFRINFNQTREQVIEKYKQHLNNQIKTNEITKSDLLAIKNKPLVCFCYPKACHGEVILNAIKEET